MTEEILEKTAPKINDFNKKSVIRLIIFGVLSLITYAVCTISLFFYNGLITPILSFIVLFLLIYFIALDCYKVKFNKILLILFIIFLLEIILFIFYSGFSWYLVIELVLFNLTIGMLLYLLTWQLNNRTYFSPFSYFTEGGFLITTLLTIFFCVLMMGKYTQIPFTCDDIETFPKRVVETTVNPFKKTWNNIIGWFENDEKMVNKPDLYVMQNPLSESSDLAGANVVENFFTNVKNSIQSGTVTLDVQNQVSKATCNRYIAVLQKTQKSGGIQIAGIIIGYLLLVGIFKILLRIVSIIGFLLFLLLRLFGLYKYEKRVIEKEVIV